MKKGTKLYGAGDLVQYLLHPKLSDETTKAILRKENIDENFKGHMDDVRAAMRQVAGAPNYTAEGLLVLAKKRH